jgi:hypothetical protein
MQSKVTYLQEVCGWDWILKKSPTDPDVGNLLQLHLDYDMNMQNCHRTQNSLPDIRPSFPEKKNWYSHNTKILILMVCKQCCRNCPIQRRRPFRITRFLNFAHCPVVLYSATCPICNTSWRSESTNQANLRTIGLYLPQSLAFPKKGMYYQMAQLRTKI